MVVGIVKILCVLAIEEEKKCPTLGLTSELGILSLLKDDKLFIRENTSFRQRANFIQGNNNGITFFGISNIYNLNKIAYY